METQTLLYGWGENKKENEPIFLRQVVNLLKAWGLMTPNSMTSSHGLCRLVAYSHHVRCHCGFLIGFKSIGSSMRYYLYIARVGLEGDHNEYL